MSKDEALLKKLVEMTYQKNWELKNAAVFAIKNLLFKSSSEIRKNIMKELKYERILELLEDSHVKVQQQALMILRNLFS